MKNQIVDAADRERRDLLRRADAIMDAIELCRFHDIDVVPEKVRDAVFQLQQEMGIDQGRPPAHTAEIQDLLYELEEQMMADNPKSRQQSHLPEEDLPIPKPPRTTRDNGGWLTLVLPPDLNLIEQPEWAGWTEALVRRALDRWVYHRYHLGLAKYASQGVEEAERMDVAARENYVELRGRSEELFGRFSTLLIVARADDARPVELELAAVRAA